MRQITLNKEDIDIIIQEGSLTIDNVELTYEAEE